jgi:uncharacterized protein
VLSVRVQARASRNEIVGRSGDALRVRLAAPPVEGQANNALCRLLSDALDVPASAVTICSGHASRDKSVRVDGLSPAEVIARLDLV